MEKPITRKKPSSIDEALDVLESAIVTQPVAPEMGELVANDIDAVKTRVRATTKDGIARARAGADLAMTYAQERGSEVYTQVSRMMVLGVDESAKAMRDLDRRVHENPWPFLGGVAIGTFAFGFMFANRNREARNEVVMRRTTSPVAPAYPEEGIV